jgi:hypothetical protein
MMPAELYLEQANNHAYDERFQVYWYNNKAQE